MASLKARTDAGSGNPGCNGADSAPAPGHGELELHPGTACVQSDLEGSGEKVQSCCSSDWRAGSKADAKVSEF